MNNIFSKIDKKILIALVVILAVIIIAGCFVYKYLVNLGSSVENSIGGTNTENIQQLDQGTGDNIQVTPDGIQADGTNGGGTLTVCSDKCGDGVCQTSDPECNDLNCTCVEDPQECPQDCK